MNPCNIQQTRVINEYSRLRHKNHTIFTKEFLRQQFCLACCIIVIIQANIFLPDILFLVLLIQPFAIGRLCICYAIECDLRLVCFKWSVLSRHNILHSAVFGKNRIPCVSCFGYICQFLCLPPGGTVRTGADFLDRSTAVENQFWQICLNNGAISIRQADSIYIFSIVCSQFYLVILKLIRRIQRHLFSLFYLVIHHIWHMCPIRSFFIKYGNRAIHFRCCMGRNVITGFCKYHRYYISICIGLVIIGRELVCVRIIIKSLDPICTVIVFHIGTNHPCNEYFVPHFSHMGIIHADIIRGLCNRKNLIRKH